MNVPARQPVCEDLGFAGVDAQWAGVVIGERERHGNAVEAPAHLIVQAERSRMAVSGRGQVPIAALADADFGTAGFRLGDAHGAVRIGRPRGTGFHRGLAMKKSGRTFVGRFAPKAVDQYEGGFPGGRYLDSYGSGQFQRASQTVEGQARIDPHRTRTGGEGPQAVNHA